jgi:hypothetical protein
MSARPETAAARLQKRLVKRPLGCWVWTGGCFASGYGSINAGSGSVYTHRLAWELANGPIPDGLMVCHHCDNRRCCRPEHLFLGTAADNSQDAKDKGQLRGAHVPRRGERHPKARLSDVQVGEIRQRRAEGETLAALGAAYGVTLQQIWNIVNFKSRVH